MRKRIICLFCMLCFLTGKAQNYVCESYEQNDDEINFNLSGGGILQLKICSPSMVRIWFAPDGKPERKNPSFAVINEKPGETGSIQVNEEPASYEIFTSALRIRLNKSPLSLQIFDKYQKLLFSDYKDEGYRFEGTSKTTTKIMRPDEHFFGLGEKTGKMDRRGGSFRMWNSDRPCYSTTEDPLYKSIPFFISSYRYGIFLDNTYKTSFDFGTAANDQYSFSVPDGPMLYYFIFGKDYKDILNQYVSLTGQPIIPPKWGFGFAQSRGMLTNEELSRSIANGYRERGIPCDIIYQDIGWTSGLQTFDWRPGNYENPRKMLSDLAAEGFKVVVSQDPVVSQSCTQQWEEANRLGYFVKDSTTGKSYDMPWPWGGNCGVVDFTLPEVADWWGAYQQKPLDDGVKGFWTDMGEPAWSNEEDVDRLVMQHHAGMHDEIHNVYGLTWDKVVKEQFEKRNPNKRIFQMTRSAYAGLQRYTFGWTGDSGNSNDVTQGWGQMANQIPVMLSAGLGVIPFISTDITGYCGAITDYPAMSELFIRWLQLGIFTPLSRLHHEGNDAVEPWLFGEEAEKIAKEAIEFKYRHLPYIYTYAREAYDKGYPIMRPTFMEYPDDPETFTTDEQFMFGEELLIAPVVRKGARNKKVYLPEGEWIDYNDKKTVYPGEEWHTVKAPLHTIPMFVKSGSIIPTMPVMQYVGQRHTYPIYFDIFPSPEQKSSFTLYEDEGEDLGYQRGEYCRTTVTLQPEENGYELIVSPRTGKGYTPEGDRNFLFRIHSESPFSAILLNGEKIKEVKNNKFHESVHQDTRTVSWNYDKNTGKVCIKLPDTGEGYSLSLRK